MIEYRKVISTDLEAIRALQHTLGEEERAMMDYIKQSGTIQYIPDSEILEALEDETKLMLAATNNKQPIGVLLAEIKENDLAWRANPKRGNIAFLCVDPKFRNRGIGTLLIDKTMQWFKSNEIHEIHIGVLAKNHAAKKLYHRMGFTDNCMQMICEIK